MEPNAAQTDFIDINECKHNICHPNAPCENTPGSYYCKCIAGFSGDFLLFNAEMKNDFTEIDSKNNFSKGQGLKSISQELSYKF